MKRRPFTNTERRAKFWIARRLGFSTNELTDRRLCEIVSKEQGWPLPSKKQRKTFLARYWMLLQDQDDPTLREIAESVIDRNRSQVVRRRSGPLIPGKKFYESDAWRRLRYEALKLHGARCQCCGVSSKDGGVMHVDHIKPRSKYPELELVLSNLQVLCEACNLGKRAWDETDWRPEPEVLPEGAAEHLRSLN